LGSQRACIPRHRAYSGWSARQSLSLAARGWPFSTSRFLAAQDWHKPLVLRYVSDLTSRWVPHCGQVATTVVFFLRTFVHVLHCLRTPDVSPPDESLFVKVENWVSGFSSPQARQIGIMRSSC
jgi:hypothetical protein